MKLRVRSFIYHKNKESYKDCNDKISVNFNTNKFAISDGVTSSFLPDIWAELLVNEFVSKEGKINQEDPISLEKLQDKWYDNAELFANQEGQAWFIKTFFEEGRSAAATFAGLHFYLEKQILNWEAIAIGDSFIFFIPNNKNDSEALVNKGIETVLPDKANFIFNNYPEHLDSTFLKPKGNYTQVTDKVLKEGVFFLMTDAVAEWFIKNTPDALVQISQWNSLETFVTQIKKLRRSKKIINDDSSILIIEVSDDGKTELSYEN
jgi:hypothetical protein